MVVARECLDKTLPLGYYLPSWTGITENTLHQILHYCNPLQNVHQKLNIENHNEDL